MPSDRRWHFWSPLPFLSTLKSRLNNLSRTCLAINVKLTSPRLLESHFLEKWYDGTFSWLLGHSRGFRVSPFTLILFSYNLRDLET